MFVSRVNTENHLYRHFDADNNLLYVGISVDALKRLKQHNKKAKWFNDIAHITIEKFPDRKSVEEAEIKAIKIEKPKHNVTHAVRASVIQNSYDCTMEWYRNIAENNKEYRINSLKDSIYFELKMTAYGLRALKLSYSIKPVHGNTEYNQYIVDRKKASLDILTASLDQLIRFLEQADALLDKNYNLKV